MLLEMTITFCELNSNFLPVQFRVGVKNCPFFFFFFCLVCFLFYLNCLMMQCLSKETQCAWLNRPSGFTVIHLLKKQNKNIKSRKATNTSLEDPTGLQCTKQDSDRWTDECSFAFTSCTDDRCLCVSFCNTNSILHSLFPGPFTVGGQLCVSSVPEPGFYLKGHQVLLLSKCHCRIRAD